MFYKAIPVYAENKSREMNTHLVLRETVPSLQDARLLITGYSFFRLWVNGTFVFFGPSRAAGGYARVENLDLTAYHKEDGNELIVEVCGYGCGSLASVDQPSYVAAELRRGEDVLLYTGRDFEGFCPNQKVQKAERYSVQRHFGEVWDFTGGDPFAPQNRVNLVPVQTELTWLTSTPKPCFDYTPARIHSLGAFVQDDTRPVRKNRYSWAEVPAEWGIFPEAELETIPHRWIQKQKMTPGTKCVDFPVTLTAGQYAMMDLDKLWCGFLETELTALEDTVLVLGYSELCEKDTFAFTNINMQNVIEYRFSAGDRRSAMSFEPYTCRHAVIMVKTGSIRLHSFGIRRYEYDSARILPRSFRDTELKRIYDAAVRSFTHNVVDIYMDCPSRERAGWLCDSFFMGRVEHFLTGQCAVEDAFLENYRLHTGKGGLPEGILPECYPSDFEGNFIPQWNLWYILQVYEYLTVRNRKVDKDLFRKSIYGILSFVAKYENADGLLQNLPSWNFVEWSRANRWVQDVNYPTNFLYARALECAGDLYRDAVLRKKAETVRTVTREKSFNGEIFVDHAVLEETGCLRNKTDFSEAGQYYAILFGGVELDAPAYAKLKAHVLDGFAAFDPAAETYVPTNMFIGYYLRLLVLLKLDRRQILGCEIKKKFAPMIDLTDTLWEYNFHQRNGSYDHGFASFAAICAWVADQG